MADIAILKAEALNLANRETHISSNNESQPDNTPKTETPSTNANEIGPSTANQPDALVSIEESSQDIEAEPNSDDKIARNRDDATRTRAQDTFQEVIEDFHEDDLSDLVVDQQPTEDVSPIGSEASPYIAASSTGNMFFFAPNAGHCQASFACPTSYENALNTFLNRCIG